MQCRRSEHSRREYNYSNSSMGLDPFEMRSGWFDGNLHDQNINAMMASNRLMSDYGCFPPPHHSYGPQLIQVRIGPMPAFGVHAMNSGYGGIENGNMGGSRKLPKRPGKKKHPRLSRHSRSSSSSSMSSRSMSGYSGVGHNLDNEYRTMNRMIPQEKSQCYTMQELNIPAHKEQFATMKNLSIPAEEKEYSSGSDYDDDDSSTDSEHDSCDSESDLEDQYPRGHRPMY